MPRALAPGILNRPWALIQKRYPIPVEQPTDLHFTAGFVRRFPWRQAVFQPRCAYFHASFTCVTSLATRWAESLSRRSLASISLNSLLLCACSF